MTTEAFEGYIREQLAPRLRPGQIMVLDNLSAHKGASMREALAARGCDLLFLPPYSPDFNPIEQAFSKLKAILRGLGARTQDMLQEAARLAIAAITSADAAVCPYRLPPPCSTYLKVALTMRQQHGRSSSLRSGHHHVFYSILPPASCGRDD